MNIQFDGFQHTIPVFWIIFLFIGTLVLSYWTYRNANTLSTAWRVTLSAFRSAAFLILLLILLNPVISLIETVPSPVKLSVLFDNSQSTTIRKGTYDGEERYREIMRMFSPEFTGNDFENVVIERFGFDSDLFPLDALDELTLEGSRTNIDQALAGFMDIKDRHEAVVLITDGIVTSGRDPSATAARMPVPIYTVGIGDTSRQKDVVVQRIVHNPTASLNSMLTVEAYIYNDGFPDQDIPVQLIHEGEVLQEVITRSRERRSVQQVRFESLMEEEGLQQLRIHVPEVPGEWTTENNTRWFSVDVRDDRLRVLHLAYEAHPDVRNIRRLLTEDKQISLENRTWIVGERYVEGELPDRPDTLDLVILHGFPHMDLDDNHARQIADRFSENALFLIGSAGQDLSRLSSLFPGILPLRYQSGFRWHDVQFHLPTERSGHTVLDFEYPKDLRVTPVRGGIRNSGTTSGATALLKTNYRGNQTAVPLLAVRTVGERNISHLNAYNMFRWSLSTRDDTRLFWENLLNNVVKWTAAQPDEQLLQLIPAEPVFQTGEPVVINGFLRNEAGEPVDNGIIEIAIESDDVRERRYIMSNEGYGRYQLEIGSLPEGSYRFAGTASRGARELDSRSGTYSVSGVNREYLNTVRDDDLLRFIAQTSGGRFLAHGEVGNLFGYLDKDIGMEQRLVTTSESLAIHRNPLWFLLVIILLTAEWGLRKYQSMQ